VTGVPLVTAKSRRIMTTINILFFYDPQNEKFKKKKGIAVQKLHRARSNAANKPQPKIGAVDEITTGGPG